MAEKCIMAGSIEGAGYEKMFEQSRRVYSPDGTAPTLHTVGGGNLEPKIIEPKLVGGVGEMKSNGGTQYYQQDRIYDSENVAAAHPANLPGGSYNYQVKEKRKYRIRKLTPKECGRLMGVKDEDIAELTKRQSQSLQYHLFGDSIVTACLMAIFGKLLGADYNEKIDELGKELSKEYIDGGGYRLNDTDKKRNEARI